MIYGTDHELYAVKIPKIKICLFCPAKADSKEHVIPEWLSKRMERREMPFRPGRFNLEQGHRMHGPVVPKSYTARHVCAGCNSGLMSRLESEVMRVIGRFVEPKLIGSDPEFQDADTLLLSRWMVKTAIIMDTAFPKPRIHTIKSSMIAFARGDVELEYISCFSAVIRTSDLNASLTKGFPTWNGANFPVYQAHSESIRFALHLNHLGLMLIRCPEATVSFRPTVTTLDGRVCMPLINGLSVPLPQAAVSHTFPDFNSFRDSIGVDATTRTADSTFSL